MAGQLFARDERTIEVDAEPGAELVGFAECAPYAFARSLQQNLFLDAVGAGVHRIFPYATMKLHVRTVVEGTQPYGCPNKNAGKDGFRLSLLDHSGNAA